MPSSLRPGSKHRRVSTASIATILAAAMAIGVPAATAATHHAAGTAPTAALKQASQPAGFPTFVNLPADQPAHADVPQEWWYIMGHFTSHGQQYGYLVSFTAQGNASISLTDVTTQQYYESNQTFPTGEFSVSSSDLDIQFPDGSLSGPMNDMHLTAQLPGGHGSLDLTLDARGPVMYAAGTGLIPLLGGQTYYYSLPDVQSTGAMTFDGKTMRITGQSWLDHQWGDFNFGLLDKWTWMGIQLSDNEYVNLADVFDNTGEHVFATVLNPDGSEDDVAVTPLAQDAGDFQTSTMSGQRYAGTWVVDIPSLHTRLKVTATPVLQEFPNGGFDEAESTVSGTFQGKPVTGSARVEQVGVWK